MINAELIIESNTLQCCGYEIEIQGGQSNGVHFWIGLKEFETLEEAVLFCQERGAL